MAVAEVNALTRSGLSDFYRPGWQLSHSSQRKSSLLIAHHFRKGGFQTIWIDLVVEQNLANETSEVEHRQRAPIVPPIEGFSVETGGVQ